MQLLDHLKLTNERIPDFAKRVGIGIHGLRKIAYGQRAPSLKVAVDISEATNGAVTPADLLLTKPQDQAA